jgi:hypothetical protein
MANNSKRKLLFIALFLITMLSSAAYTSLIPNVCASEVTTQQKAIDVLNSVVGLNMTTYTANLNKESNSTLSGLPQEETNFNLISSEGSLRARCSYVNGKLHQIYLSDYTGSLSLNQPNTNTLNMAKDFMARYQSYMGDSFYGKLSSMLDSVFANENLSKTLGSVKLEVSVFGDEAYKNLVWTYVDENGVPAVAKNVVLSYDHGRLQSFMDNWKLYRIAGVPKLSSDDAITIALKATQNFSWTAYTNNDEVVTVSDFKVVSIGNATLSYLNYYEHNSPRDGDPFTLYPSWYIPLGFDKVYPGSVTGAIVRVWADTGEVGSIGAMVSGGVPLPDDITTIETESQGSPLEVFFAIVLAIGVVGICFCCIRLRSKRKSPIKSSISKVSVTLLCIMISFSLILTTTPNASAITKVAETYVSQYGQTQMDMQYMGGVSGHITSVLSSAGFYAFNNYGYLTTWSNYQYYTWWDQYYGDFTTVFHYGHMADQNNLKLSDGKVLTSGLPSGNVDSWVYAQYEFYFIWLWACMQANGPRVGMPPAWANWYYLTSTDGYHYPDPYGPYCFIGFQGMSPSIYYGSFRYSTCQAWVFIEKVYDYLASGYSVHDSLNQASMSVSTFHLPYDQSPLFLGFESWWPANYGDPPFPQGWYQGWMKVYGHSGLPLVW